MEADMKPNAVLTVCALAVALVANHAAAAPAGGPAKDARMPAPIVFLDIVATELPGQAAFYKTVFDWDIAADGAFSVPVIAPLRATMRIEKAGPNPVAERVIYIGVADINHTLDQIKAHGGGVVLPRLEVPGVAVLGLFTDPAGNRMGLVEMAGDKAKAP
jgi:predicted enzyme related to lactoylglutathione lyase